MKKGSSLSCLYVGMLGLLIGFSQDGGAREFRPGFLPNGFQNACINCHTSPAGGGPRNPFGQAVEALVTPGGMQQFWGPALAAMDSDGDGFTNGQELQDPAGAWRPGDPAPGDASLVTNPGNPNDFPEGVITSPADAWVAILTADKVVRNEGPVESDAYGTAVIQLHEPEMKLLYYLNVFGLENVTAAHIHIGAPGANGPVVHPFTAPTTGASTGEIDVTAENIQNLKAGNYYVQVHTSQYPGGEIRGQLEDKPIEFVATLDSAQVVADPPITSAGTGTLTATLNEDMTEISFTLKVSNLQNITLAHFHFGKVGVSGGVAITISGGPFTDEVSGTAPVPADALDDLLAEGLYVNVHTQQFPSGEIRGQVVMKGVTAPTSSVPAWEHNP